MPFFSFYLLNNSLKYKSSQIVRHQKYYSKDIDLWKELNNRNKFSNFCVIKNETRYKINEFGKKILICLPPKYGMGDAIEYGLAIKQLINSRKFDKVGIAFCSDFKIIFTKLFSILNIYPLFISNNQMEEYDTIFHLTLEIKALKFQKYKRSNITSEISNYFKLEKNDFEFKIKNKDENYKKSISIFPVSTSTIRSMPYEIIKSIVQKFENDYDFRIIIDNSLYSKHLEKKNLQNKFLFINPKNIDELILEISKINFGIFMDSGPMHLAKIFDKKGILIETSVKSSTLLSENKNIFPLNNFYTSKYCKGPCGLVDIFSYDNNVGCYETNKISFKDIKKLKSFKNLQRWNKKDNNAHFISNPVGCIKNIDVNNMLDLIKLQIKEN